MRRSAVTNGVCSGAVSRWQRMSVMVMTEPACHLERVGIREGYDDAHAAAVRVAELTGADRHDALVVGMAVDDEDVVSSLLVVSSEEVAVDPVVVVTCPDEVCALSTGSAPALTRNHSTASTVKKMARLTPATRSQEGRRAMFMVHTIGAPARDGLGGS